MRNDLARFLARKHAAVAVTAGCIVAVVLVISATAPGKSPAYNAGYSFGSASQNPGTPESSALAADTNPPLTAASQCFQLAADGLSQVPLGDGIPGSEDPPDDPAGNTQWQTGCIAGINAAS
jgi:hypothetical protein